MSNQLSQPSEPQTFDLAEVESAIATTLFRGHLHHLASTSSTNEVALKAALAGTRTGVWIADRQIAGRGRGGHTWHSPAGAGLYMTALIAPAIPMQSALGLSLRVALAVQSAIASTFGFRIPDQIDIRWPNDLMLNGKKCGGILIDTASNPATATRTATLRHAIIGIGINLHPPRAARSRLIPRRVFHAKRREQHEVPKRREQHEVPKRRGQHEVPKRREQHEVP